MALAQVGAFLDKWIGIYPIIAATSAYIIYLINPTHPFGISKKRFIHNTQTIELTQKDGKKISFAELCEEVVPPCKLNPLLFNGHVQTVFASTPTDAPEIYYKRWLFENSDPAYSGTYAVDFVTKPYEGSDSTLPPRTTYYTQQEFENLGSDDTKPMLVVLHGLSGGSFEAYLRRCVGGLITEADDWEACVINFRGCANHKITTTVLYNARATWDTKFTVEWLRRKFPNRPLFALGFSMGANVLTNYIGERGLDCDFKAAVLISNPWNLEASFLALNQSFLGRDVYLRVLGTNMRKLFEKHVDVIRKNPLIDVEKIRKGKFLYDFDRDVQLPSFGYPATNSYYRDASSVDSLLAVRIPILALNAIDDPVAHQLALPWDEVKATPYSVMCATNGGGHIGWFEVGGGRWFSRVTTNFFQKMAKEIDLDKIPRIGNPEFEGHIERKHQDPLKPLYNPVRRKLYRVKD